jgi:thiosulfate reductase cytochrome b subunit
VAFLALVVTGLLIVISHPRFYWGEVGNVNTRPLFQIPIPSSRETVPTGYRTIMPDENGWGRALHFEAAWVLVLAGLVYGIYGLWSGHFRRDLAPERRDRRVRAYWRRLAKYLRREPADEAEERSYNVLQRTAYLVVIFGLFPVMIWTGLAMSPSFTAAFPWLAAAVGGRQSARTIHFFVTWLLVLFLFVHVGMVATSGFWRRVRGMILGRARGGEGEGQ